MIRFNADSMPPITAGLNDLGTAVVQALNRRAERQREDKLRADQRGETLADRADQRAYSSEQSQVAYDREQAGERAKQAFTHGENDANRGVQRETILSREGMARDKTKAALLERIIQSRKQNAANSAKLAPDELASAYVEAGLTAQGLNLQQITDPILGAISYKAAPYTPQQTQLLKAALDKRRAAKGLGPTSPNDIGAIQAHLTAGLDDELSQYGISLSPDGAAAAPAAADAGAPAAGGAAPTGNVEGRRAQLLQALDRQAAGVDPSQHARVNQIRSAIQGAQSDQDLDGIMQTFGAKQAGAPAGAAASAPALAPAEAPAADLPLPPRRGPMHRTIAPPAGPAPAPAGPQDPRMQSLMRLLSPDPSMAPAMAPGPPVGAMGGGGGPGGGLMPPATPGDAMGQALMTGQAPPRPIAFGMAQRLAGLVPAPGGHYDPATGQIIPYQS